MGGRGKPLGASAVLEGRRHATCMLSAYVRTSICVVRVWVVGGYLQGGGGLRRVRWRQVSKGGRKVTYVLTCLTVRK